MKLLSNSVITILLLLIVVNYYLELSSISTGLQWSCMEPLPNKAKDIKIANGGSVFTREFAISFSASKSEFENWVNKSKGTKNAETKKIGEVTYYHIKPCGGAQYANISINWSTLKVYLKTYWS